MSLYSSMLATSARDWPQNSKCIEAAHVGAGPVARGTVAGERPARDPTRSILDYRLYCEWASVHCIPWHFRSSLYNQFHHGKFSNQLRSHIRHISAKHATTEDPDPQHKNVCIWAWVVGGHAIIIAYVWFNHRVTLQNVYGFNQHAYDEHFSARAQNTGSCLCEGSNETTTVVVKITTGLSTHCRS